MAGPRERSRHRDMEPQTGHEMQEMPTSYRSSTAQRSTAHDEDSEDDRRHGHGQSSGAQRLDRRILRTCKERLAGALRMCREGITKQRIMMIVMVFIGCILFLYGRWAFRGHELGSSTGRAMGHYQSSTTTTTTTKYGSSTVYITHYVHYAQFHDARPLHHQEPMAVPSNLEAMGRVTRQDLTATSAPVSGLYFMPMSVTSGGWPQMEQDSRLSSRSASNTEGPQTLQGSFSLVKSEPGVILPLQSREIDAPRNLFASQADADTSYFTRWGVELLYDMHRRSRPSYNDWCIQNACSSRKQLTSMCNTNKTISDPFRKQECEWCWPEDQRKDKEINQHCSNVSKRALDAMFIICGIFFFCTLVIAIVLATRVLRHRRKAKADRSHVTNAFPLQEKINGTPGHWFSHSVSKSGGSSKAAKFKVDDIKIGKRSPGEAVGLNLWYRQVFAKSGKRSGIGPEKPVSGRLRTRPLDQAIAVRHEDSHERVPVLPPAPPAIRSRVFSDIENMGQGSFLSGSRIDNNNEHDPQGLPRRSSRQSRAVSSGSEQSSSGGKQRRDAGTRHYDLERLTERS